MTCRKCGVENPESAVFCGACGARLDGKKPCPSCGQLNEEAFSFCMFCGAKMQPELPETQLEPNEETAIAEAVATQPKPKMNREELERKITSWSDRIQSIALLIGACFALLFVFFIGGTFGYGELGESDEALRGLAPAENLYYFFYGIYRDIADVSLGKAYFNGLARTPLYAYGITGTLAVTATLICTAVFSLRAIYAFVMNTTKKSEKRSDKYALGAIVSFLIGSLVFSLLNVYGAEISLGITIANRYELNAATEWGIALGALAILVASVCAILKKGFGVWKKASLIKIGIFALTLLVGAIALGVAQIASIGMSAEQSGIGMSIDVGFSKIAQAMVYATAVNASRLGGSLYAKVTTELEIGVIAYTVATVLSVAALTAIGLSLWKKLRSVYTGELQSGSTLSIVGAALALVVLIAAIVGNSCMTEVGRLVDSATGSSEQFEFSLGGVIVAFALSLLNVVGSFVMKKFCAADPSATDV